MPVSTDHLHHKIHEWARALWMLNRRNTAPAEQLREDFDARWIDAIGTRGRAQNASAQGFTLLCYGMATVESVTGASMQGVSSSRLVDSWRQRVFRDGFQPHYTLFEEILKETIDSHGVAAAAMLFPPSHSDVADFAAALRAVNCKSTRLAPGTVEEVVLLSGKLPRPAPHQGRGRQP